MSLRNGGFNFDDRLESLIREYRKTCSLREDILFRHFLPTGYRMTTLSSVGSPYSDMVILAKMHLGMIVTLYDDLADHPHYRNPKLLQKLYRLNIDRDLITEGYLTETETALLDLSRYLFQEMTLLLKEVPGYEALLPLLRFDIEQFYSSNKYSELMSAMPSIRNLQESQVLGAHNMGMVAAGMIDLMASPDFVSEELGEIRDILLLGQRLGRISNLVFTYNREVSEGDSTNEISIATDPEGYRQILLREFQLKGSMIRGRKIRSFSVEHYANGLEDLHRLHSALEGRI